MGEKLVSVSLQVLIFFQPLTSETFAITYLKHNLRGGLNGMDLLSL